MDWALLGAHLETSGELQLPALRQIAERLRDLTDGRTITRVVDVGAGPGAMACVLAQVFSDAEVVRAWRRVRRSPWRAQGPSPVSR